MVQSRNENEAKIAERRLVLRSDFLSAMIGKGCFGVEVQLITMGYVYQDDESSYVLEYYREAYEDRGFGVRIVTYKDGKLLEERAERIPGDENLAVNMIHVLAKKFVFPVHLADILCDLEESAESGWQSVAG